MTYLRKDNGQVSDLNNSDIALVANATFQGGTEDVQQYSSVQISLSTDTESAPLGIKFQFSTDQLNWDTEELFTFDGIESHFSATVQIKARYFRLVYTNGSTNQTYMRLQTLFNTSQTEQKVEIQESLIDGFNRLRVSQPFTLLSNNHIDGKHEILEDEKIAGLATSVHNPDASCVNMSTTGAGSVLRRSRERSIYLPGKSLLIYLTGVLNTGSNAADVTTRIGYYDQDNGYYFQHLNGIVSIVERTSITGSLVENVIPQSQWNVNQFPDFDTTKGQIFWLNFEWLGTGYCRAGIVINGELLELHRFRHANILENVYISMASLPVSYEISSTGGNGGMRQICYCVISEGGYNPKGITYSANTGNTTQNIGGTITPLIAVRLKSTGNFPKMIAKIKKLNVISTSNANGLVSIYKFSDLDATSVLTGSSFASVHPESAVEYDTAATAINLTNGIQIDSSYISNNNDQLTFKNNNQLNFLSTNIDGISDLIVVAIQTIGGQSESYCGSVTWKELI